VKKWHFGQRLLHSLSQSSEPQFGQAQRKSVLRAPVGCADWVWAVRVVGRNSLDELMASPPGTGEAHGLRVGRRGQESSVLSSSM